jgi:hypothetical protein
MARIHGLTHDELKRIGDPAALAQAINTEMDSFLGQVLSDPHDMYTDDEVHAIIDARLAALPETGPERTAIQKTYELLLAIIDGGEADARSDHELMHWVNGDGTEWCPGFRPAAA